MTVSVLSWSGTPDMEDTAASHFRSNNSFTETSTNVQASEHIIRNVTNHANSVVKKTSKTENKIQTSKQTSEHQNQDKDKFVNTNVKKYKKLEDWTRCPESTEMKLPVQNETLIHVKNYK